MISSMDQIDLKIICLRLGYSKPLTVEIICIRLEYFIPYNSIQTNHYYFIEIATWKHSVRPTNQNFKLKILSNIRVS